MYIRLHITRVLFEEGIADFQKYLGWYPNRKERRDLFRQAEKEAVRFEKFIRGEGGINEK